MDKRIRLYVVYANTPEGKELWEAFTDMSDADELLERLRDEHPDASFEWDTVYMKER